MSDESFKARIADELGQLRGRERKLTEFIDENPAFGDLPRPEQRRLTMQVHHMRAYESVLAARAQALHIEVRTIASEKILLEPVVLLLAFRYMLGRQTAMVHTFIELLEQHLDAVARWHAQMVSDIQFALSNDQAGAEVDAKAWRRLMETIEARSERT